MSNEDRLKTGEMVEMRVARATAYVDADLGNDETGIFGDANNAIRRPFATMRGAVLKMKSTARIDALKHSE